MHPDTLFNPSPAQQADLLHILAIGHTTLPDLAARFNTSTPALALFLSTGPFAETFANLASTNATVIRFAAGMQLPNALRLLQTLLITVEHQIRTLPVDPADPTSIDQSRRRIDVGRHITNALLRLSRFTGEPRQPREARETVLTPAHESVQRELASPSQAPRPVQQVPIHNTPTRLPVVTLIAQPTTQLIQLPATQPTSTPEPSPIPAAHIEPTMNGRATSNTPARNSSPKRPEKRPASTQPLHAEPESGSNPHQQRPQTEPFPLPAMPDSSTHAERGILDLEALANRFSAFADMIEATLPQPAS
ncbi:MAG: hypothetical protein PSX37_08250 [bacterium]|nr:hypothetical protein [bacterium]